jgi:hypothetical protein
MDRASVSGLPLADWPLEGMSLENARSKPLKERFFRAPMPQSSLRAGELARGFVIIHKN